MNRKLTAMQKSVVDFVETRLVRNAKGRLPKSEVYEAYRSAGGTASMPTFRSVMRELNVPESWRCYEFVQWKSPASSPTPSA